MTSTRYENWNRVICLLVWEVIWHQWFEKMSEACTYWQKCLDHQKKATFVTNMGKLKRPVIGEEYSQHMGFVDKGDRMANSYSSSLRTRKWKKIYIFFHLLDITTEKLYYFFILQEHNRSQKILSGFGSKFVGNEWKGASSLVHPKRKTVPTNQQNYTPWSPTHGVLASCRIMHPSTNEQLLNSSVPSASAKSCCAESFVLEYTTQK